MTIFVILVAVVAAVLLLAERPLVQTITRILPTPIWIYATPMALTSLDVLPASSDAYTMLGLVLVPVSLFLLTVSSDFRSTLRIGPLAVCAIPFETFTEIGLELKEKSPFASTFTVELANGWNGYLPTPEVIATVGRLLDRLEGVPVVLDPVLAASDGTPLLERRAFGTLSEIAARAVLVTPNRPEAALLTGEDTRDDAGAQRAAEILLRGGARAVLVKGGHREGAPCDLLARSADEGTRLDWLESERIGAGPVHGTGCALAAAVAAHLARGADLVDAVARARAFVHDALRRAEGPYLVFPPAN